MHGWWPTCDRRGWVHEMTRWSRHRRRRTCRGCKWRPFVCMISKNLNCSFIPSVPVSPPSFYPSDRARESANNVNRAGQFSAVNTIGWWACFHPCSRWRHEIILHFQFGQIVFHIFLHAAHSHLVKQYFVLRHSCKDGIES